MITIKTKDDAAILARIEKVLSGEDIDIFVTEEDENGDELPLDKVIARISYNLNRSRIYMGRMVGNTQRQYEEARELNELLLPISIYFGLQISDMLPEHMLPRQTQRLVKSFERYEFLKKRSGKDEGIEEVNRQEIGPKAALSKQREMTEKLREEGKLPKE